MGVEDEALQGGGERCMAPLLPLLLTCYLLAFFHVDQNSIKDRSHVLMASCSIHQVRTDNSSSVVFKAGLNFCCWGCLIALRILNAQSQLPSTVCKSSRSTMLTTRARWCLPLNLAVQQ